MLNRLPKTPAKSIPISPPLRRRKWNRLPQDLWRRPSSHSNPHTKTGETICSVTMPVQVSREDYQAINRAAVRNGGRWSSFRVRRHPWLPLQERREGQGVCCGFGGGWRAGQPRNQQNEGSKQPVPSEASAAPEAVRLSPMPPSSPSSRAWTQAGSPRTAPRRPPPSTRWPRTSAPWMMGSTTC